MSTKTVYLTFKVNIQSKNDLSSEDMKHFLEEFDYEIVYPEALQDKIDYLCTELAEVVQ